MTTNEDKILTVARYLEGDMEKDEQISFEGALAVEEELQNLVAAYRNLHQTLEMHLVPSKADLDVNAKLLHFNDQYFKTKSVAKIIPLKQYLKWGSVAAVLIIGLLVWAPWSADLYKKYAVVKEMSVAERGDDESNGLQKAAEFYNQKNFAAATELLKKEYQKDPGNSLVVYYYGLSLMEINQPKEARGILTQVYNGESVFKYDAAYSIALSYLKQDDKAQTLSWLSKVPQGNGNYEKAKELIEKLK